MATITLSASEFQDQVGEALDCCSLSQLVLITSTAGRAIFFHNDEYLSALRARDRQRAVRAEDLTHRRGHRCARGAEAWGRGTSISTPPNSRQKSPRAESAAIMGGRSSARRGGGDKNRPCALVAATRPWMATALSRS